MATILVTGGAGYIGSHACKALAEAGHLPVAYDSLVTGWRKAVRFGPFEQGDLNDASRLDEVLARHRPDAVMHFAALSNVGEASEKPLLYWRNNVGGTIALLDAMARAGIRRLVFSSTCAVYGDHDGVTLDETCPTVPLNAYGASKLAVERILETLGAASHLDWVSFRYFNVAGADRDATIGEHHRPETHLIPLCLDAASGRRPALKLFGEDYPTRDGTCIRDYIHVEDLVAGHILGLDHLLNGGASMAFNLGTGTGSTVREVIDAVVRVTGLPVPVETVERRAGDAISLVSGSTRAQAVLGWQPRHDLDSVIRSAWAWHQKGDVFA
ncbi:MAG: UDP-glucose 4-epimerase GalE [Rubricella sp.]